MIESVSGMNARILKMHGFVKVYLIDGSAFFGSDDLLAYLGETKAITSICGSGYERGTISRVAIQEVVSIPAR